MILNARTASERPSGKADVLVIGAGAVGLPLAVKLARAGKRVALLEAGERGLRPTSQAMFEEARALSRPHAGLHTGRFRMLGGTSNFWGGQLVAFEPHIFAPRPWLGDGLEWPIARSDLDPFYEEALNLLGMVKAVRTDAELIDRLRLALPDVADDLQYFFTRWVPQPELAAHFDADLLREPSLLAYLDAHVVALSATEAGDRVTGATILGSDGERHVIAADEVVLANGTVEIARLLMQPLSDGRSPSWSRNPWLGHGFMDHLDATAGRLRIADERRFRNLFENVVLDNVKYQPKVRLTAAAQKAHGLCDISAHLIFNSTMSEHFANAKIFLRSFLRGRFDRDLRSYPQKLRSLVQVGIPMVRRYLSDNRVYAPADAGVDLRITAEQLPLRESRIVLSDRRDRAGMAIADLDWRLDGRELETVARFAELVGGWLTRSGLANVELDPALVGRDAAFSGTLRDANHHMGGARMATSAQDGVVDRDCTVFGAANLHVAGAATYRSAGFPNPTFTAIALGLRIGERLLGRA